MSNSLINLDADGENSTETHDAEVAENDVSANAEKNEPSGEQKQEDSKDTEHSFTFEENGEALKIPRQYWDEENARLNIAALLKSTEDLRRKVTELPKAPEEYELKVPEDLAEIIQADNEDPRAVQAMEWGKKYNIPQEAFSELTEIFYRTEAEGFVNPEEYAKEQLAELKNEFGKNADEQIATLERWATHALKPTLQKSPELLEELEKVCSSARGVRLVKAFMESTSGEQIPSRRDIGSKSQISEKDLKNMMADPKYFRDRDPVLVKKVEEGFKQLYPD